MPVQQCARRTRGLSARADPCSDTLLILTGVYRKPLELPSEMALV
jgi:hypothetical protein